MKIRTAFTLIELLVVIAIIGILSGLIVVAMDGVTSKANIAKARVFSNSLRSALMLNFVSEWKFDELTTAVNTTSIQDSWGSSNGSVNGIGITVKDGSDCVNVKCIDLNNTSIANLSRIDISSINLPTGLITLNYWVYYRGASRYNGGVFSSSNWGATFQINNQSGNVFAYVYTRSTYAETTLYFADSSSLTSDFYFSGDVTNKWKLLTLIYDGNNVRFFEDAKELPSVSKVGQLNSSNNSTIKIGNLTTYWIDGKFDDIRVYNAAISTSQIKEQYYAGLNSLLVNGNISIEEYKERINSIAKQ